MAVVRLVEEDEAPGAVQDVYQDIKSTLGIDFVPNMYKAMANDPEYLMSDPGTAVRARCLLQTAPDRRMRPDG